MFGGVAFFAFVLAPRGSRRVEMLWFYTLLLFLIWLGVGLLIALFGFRHGNLAGRICALVAIAVFIVFVLWVLIPTYTSARRIGAWPPDKLMG
jgi:hypothetical protein